jgi:hypothetical protein
MLGLARRLIRGPVDLRVTIPILALSVLVAAIGIAKRLTMCVFP